MNKLNITIAGENYKNPVFLASGTAGFGFEIGEIFDISQLGGFVAKTITVKPREGNPPPRIWETPCGMLNSIGLTNPGIESFVSDVAPRLSKLSTEIVVSVGGGTEEEFCQLVETVSELDFVSAIELNLSCPNVKKGGIQIGRDSQVVNSLLKQVRKLTAKPLWAKLTPQVTDIVELGLSAQDAGADALVVANTLPAMAIDIHTRKPQLGAKTGGLSGPAIHPVAVALIFKLKPNIAIPIIGVGGIGSPEDAIELMIAGASAVQIGSGYFSDTTLPLRTIEFMKSYIDDKGFDDISQIVGSVIIN